MANDVTASIINEGPSKLVVSITIVGDGSGELVNFPVLDPTTDFNPTLPLGTQLSVTQLWASTAWFDVAIAFNGVVPTVGWVHSRDTSNYNDFRYFGGLKDRSNEDPDGKLLLSTSGLGAGMIGTLVLELKKN